MKKIILSSLLIGLFTLSVLAQNEKKVEFGLKTGYAYNMPKGTDEDIIYRNLKNNFVFYILTRNKSEMINLFKQKIDLNANNQIIIESVSPEQLDGYYQKCHYGFILREDVLVNNVACPTKLVEYLYYGIVPIVLSPNIGDFEALNYDYIYYDQLADSLLPLKSNNNNLIVRNLLQRNNEFNFRNKVLMS